jgi:hypothetical protein
MREWRVGVRIAGKGKPKYSEENLLQCDFVHHKYHMDCPGTEFRPP